ncbi:histidine kinase [Rhodanobacter sp. Root627]|uniref:response regulator n=1 Tax=Rhodanobacter sp. Root627 TaxID=1736572 RepID=UPI0006FE03A4|nr:response regulator [Rhodanobacter sp. Root627]KRA30211.1 histidine kinase [Rhodanobacter sp. Root627]
MQTRSRNRWLTRLPGQKKILLAVVPLLGLFMLTSVVTLGALQRQEITRSWAKHTYEVRLAIADTQQASQAMATGARGYALSATPADLTTFKTGRSQFDENLARLRDLVADNPLQQGRVDQLQTVGTQWANGLNQTMDAMTAAGPADADANWHRLAAERLASHAAQASTVANLLGRMSETEQKLLEQRHHGLVGALDKLRIFTLLAALAGVLFGLYVIRLTNRLIILPVLQITRQMNRVASGDTSMTVTRLSRPDEIGELSRALQVFKQMVIATTDQDWVKSHLATIAQDLQKATTYRDFGQSLTSHLAPLLKTGVAMYYTHDARHERLELRGAYGLHASSDPIQTYASGDGLVGQCLQERAPIVLDRVPETYVRVHSASGEALPSHVMIQPILYRGQVTGVLELAGFEPITGSPMELLTELLPLIALTQENLSRAINTQELLERSQQQADDLRASELLMRQQKEVLRQSNEALHIKTLELEEQSQRLTVSEEELRVQAEELQASNEELRDKTDSLNRQRQVLEDLQLDTEHKAEELARASQYKSDFLANMSHELRTPLNSLLILSRSLADNDTGNLDAEQIESARIIHDAGSNLLRLINDILDLSKIEAGKMELVIDDLPLADFERSLRRTFSHVAQEKKLDFDVTIDADLPAVLRTDGARLEQVANNLIGNAFKFTVSGGVSIRIGRPDPALGLSEKFAGQPLLAISVIDTGIGIPSEKFEHIFHAFEQVDASTSRQYGGTGLGLAICLRIVELLGGDIVLQSETGKGSVFTVVLPERPPELAAMPGDSTSPTPWTPAPQPQLPTLRSEAIEDDRHHLVPGRTTILVIEDDPAFARILTDMIHRKGYQVLAAADGETGLALAHEYAPTGILLDVMLPGMDGWTVIERLKADEATRHLPVHFISASGDANRGREMGAVGFLTKPVSREAIGAAFERLLHFAEGRTRHLLIVDDDRDSRTAVRTMLHRDDLDIDEAESAEDALEKASHTRYDCIVLDLGLPGMSGVEMLQHMADSDSGVPPVVIYSGRELDREESRKLRQYTDSIVVKGARSPERLLDEVSLFLHSIQHNGHRSSAKAPVGDELKGHSVLLVDDDMRNLFALSKVLRGWGLLATMAQDGEKALKTLAENPPPDIVLMDIMMPGMDGYETIRAIRAQPALAQLPIIALTAKAMRGDREKCIEAGASDYLSKPIDIDKLGSMIRVWLPQ